MKERIYVIGFPSSSLLLVEGLIRYASNFGIDYGEQFYMDAFYKSKRGGLRISMSPQFSCTTLDEVKQSLTKTGPAVIQVICPMLDANITDVYKLLQNETCIYVSAYDPVFTIINSVTDRNSKAIFSPTKDIKRWNQLAENFDDLEVWQKREYLSEHIEYFFTETVAQLKQLTGHISCFDAYQLMTNTVSQARHIFDSLDLEITDFNAYNFLVNEWNTNHVVLTRDYLKIHDYIQSIDNDNIGSSFYLRSVVCEAIIQRHLKNKGIGLKCYGLNKFPRRVEELKEYYE
jgi:hypothetical protein